MSDSHGSGWWQASDGKWYPPDLHPTVRSERRVAPEVVSLAAAQPVAAPKKRRAGKVVAWSVAVIVGLSILGNLVPGDDEQGAHESLAATSSKSPAKEAAAAPTSTEARPKPTTTAAPKPTTTVAPTTTAPPRTTTTVDPAALRILDMQSWVSENGSIFGDITDSLGDVTTAAGDFDIVSLNVACVGLRGQIMQAQGLRAIPEPAVNDPWQKALAAYKRSAETCITGTQNVDAALLTRSANYTNEATQYLQDATAALTQWKTKNHL